MRHWILIMLLASIVVISGCASVRSSDGLVIRLQADPPGVFSNGFTVLHIDVDNRQEKSVRNVIVQLFDAGFLQTAGCIRRFDRLLPNEFQSVACSLYAPPMNESVDNEVNARVSYDSELSATQVFEMINEPEHNRRVASGSFAYSPRSYSYRDKNVMLTVGFSEEPPLVLRRGKQYFVYLTLTNVGNGFISQINPGDIQISPTNPVLPQVLNCPVLRQPVVLNPSGSEFPRIACEVVLPANYAADSISADFIVRIRYNYEAREKLGIRIIP